jgi:hypothetical protein
MNGSSCIIVTNFAKFIVFIHHTCLLAQVTIVLVFHHVRKHCSPLVSYIQNPFSCDAITKWPHMIHSCSSLDTIHDASWMELKHWKFSVYYPIPKNSSTFNDGSYEYKCSNHTRLICTLAWILTYNSYQWSPMGLRICKQVYEPWTLLTAKL